MNLDVMMLAAASFGVVVLLVADVDCIRSRTAEDLRRLWRRQRRGR